MGINEHSIAWLKLKLNAETELDDVICIVVIR